MQLNLIASATTIELRVRLFPFRAERPANSEKTLAQDNLSQIYHSLFADAGSLFPPASVSVSFRTGTRAATATGFSLSSG
jgi:hypothetical protein